jgi:hypothetical protein
VQDQRAIDRDAQFAHLGRIELGVDETQAEIRFHCLIALQEASHGLAQVALRVRVAHDIHRPGQLRQHGAAFGRETGAAVCGPVGLVRVARAQVADRSGRQQQQQCEQPAVQTSE